MVFADAVNVPHPLPYTLALLNIAFEGFSELPYVLYLKFALFLLSDWLQTPYSRSTSHLTSYLLIPLLTDTLAHPGQKTSSHQGFWVTFAWMLSTLLHCRLLFQWDSVYLCSFVVFLLISFSLVPTISLVLPLC